jgi:hypothetical protein
MIPSKLVNLAAVILPALFVAACGGGSTGTCVAEGVDGLRPVVRRCWNDNRVHVDHANCCQYAFYDRHNHPDRDCDGRSSEWSSKFDNRGAGIDLQRLRSSLQRQQPGRRNNYC